MERTPCHNLHTVQPDEWVLVCNDRTGRVLPRRVVAVDAERGTFCTAADTFTVVSPLLAQDVKDDDVVAVPVPEDAPVELWMPYARH